MAGNEQHKQHNQQLAPLYLAGEQHKRQRQQRYYPGIDSEHNAHFRGLHPEAVGDVGEQSDGNKFSGIEDESRNGQRHDAQPRNLA